MPLTFSVVIPTYNQAEFLRQAIVSVFDQTFKDFEVIVVNNYSTDHTLDVVGHFRDPRVRVINFRNNGVIGAGRNAGIKASRAPSVAFLDSDDTWYSNKLQRVAQVLRENPEVGLVCHNQQMIRDGRAESHTNYGPPAGFRGSMYHHVLGASNGPATSAAVVARRYLDQVGLFSEDPAFITVEDYELWLRLAKVCPFYFVKDVLGTHRFHSTSSSTDAERQLRAGHAVLAKLLKELHESEGGRSTRDTRRERRAIHYHYANAYYVAARSHQRRGGIKKPLRYYARTLLSHPLHKKAYAGLALLIADLLLGRGGRRRITKAFWGHSWRWG